MPIVISGTNGISGVDGTASNPSYEGTDANTGVFFPAADTVAIGTGGSERVRVDSSGNVGIGTTSPSQALTVGTTSSGKNIAIYSSSNGNNGLLRMYDLGGTERLQLGVNSTGEAVYYAPTGSVHAWYVNTERMRLDASGRLGIGATSPAYSLEVATGTSGQQAIANFRTNDSTAANNAGIQIFATPSATATSRDVYIVWDADGANSSGADYFWIYKKGNGGQVDLIQQANAPMTFQTNAVERARFTPGGYFKASDNGTYFGSTGAYHELRNSASDYCLLASNTSTGTPYGLYVRYPNLDPNNTVSAFLECVGVTTSRFIARSNGGLANYSANNVNLSDRREKTNFAPAGDYLAKICAIPVQTFNYIDQSEDDPGLTLGVVAQDVQEVAPELVMESNWGTAEEPKMRLSIYQTDLQYALMKCIQEQQQMIETLQAKVAALEAK